MKNKISKSIMFGLSTLLGLSLVVGNSFASYIVSTPSTIGVRISLKEMHTITYYVPENDTSNTFVSNTIQVFSGSNLYDALNNAHVTEDVGAYKFVSWHLNAGASCFRTDGADYSLNLVSNNHKVTDNITVYAKYVRSNVAYFNANSTDYYVYDSSSWTQINSRYLYYGDKIYSLSGVEGTAVDLRSSMGYGNDLDSGIYSLTKNASDWTVKRTFRISFVNVSAGDANWFKDGAKAHLLSMVYDDNADQYWQKLTVNDNVATVELDLKYNKFVITRGKYDTGGWGGDYCWNQTQDVTFLTVGTRTDGIHYNFEHGTLYVEAGVDGSGKKNFNWY